MPRIVVEFLDDAAFESVQRCPSRTVRSPGKRLDHLRDADRLRVAFGESDLRLAHGRDLVGVEVLEHRKGHLHFGPLAFSDERDDGADEINHVDCLSHPGLGSSMLVERVPPPSADPCRPARAQHPDAAQRLKRGRDVVGNLRLDLLAVKDVRLKPGLEIL